MKALKHLMVLSTFYICYIENITNQFYQLMTVRLDEKKRFINTPFYIGNCEYAWLPGNTAIFFKAEKTVGEEDEFVKLPVFPLKLLRGDW